MNLDIIGDFHNPVTEFLKSRSLSYRGNRYITFTIVSQLIIIVPVTYNVAHLCLNYIMYVLTCPIPSTEVIK